MSNVCHELQRRNSSQAADDEHVHRFTEHEHELSVQRYRVPLDAGVPDVDELSLLLG